MKCMVIVILAIAAVQAKPYYYDSMYPEMGGYGSGGYGAGGYGSGGSYGNSGYGGGSNGRMENGYGNHVVHTGHDIGHEQNDFDTSVHHHSSSDHNVGGATQINGGGHNMHEYGGFNGGHHGYGNNWHNGYGY